MGRDCLCSRDKVGPEDCRQVVGTNGDCLGSVTLEGVMGGSFGRAAFS